jgi:hypothetical protein
MRIALSRPILFEPALIALLLLLAGGAGVGGLVLAAIRAPIDHVCPIILPHRISSIGAVIEFGERVAEADCRVGDVLSIRGDVHLDALARFCDFARPVLLEAAQADTQRPGGAACLFVGAPRPLRAGPSG